MVDVVKTIRASGGDYSLLSTWEADIPADLVTPDERWIAETYADWLNGLNDRYAESSARVTSDTAYIAIQAAPGHEWLGQDTSDGTSPTWFKLYDDGDGSVAIIYSEHTIIKGIQISQSNVSSASGGAAIADVSDPATPTHVIGCYCLSEKNSTYRSGLSSDHVIAINCKITGRRGDDSCDFTTANSGQPQRSSLYNCIIGDGIDGNHYDTAIRGGVLNLVNCAITRRVTTFKGDVYPEGTASNNAVSNSSIPPELGTIANLSSADFVKYEVSTNDFDLHLSDTSVLIGEGLNLIESGLLTSPQYDIDGDQWPDTGAWDIGVDYAAGSTPPPTGTIKVGTETPGAIMAGSSTVDKVMIGDSQVWP